MALHYARTRPNCTWVQVAWLLQGASSMPSDLARSLLNAICMPLYLAWSLQDASSMPLCLARYVQGARSVPSLLAQLLPCNLYAKLHLAWTLHNNELYYYAKGMPWHVPCMLPLAWHGGCRWEPRFARQVQYVLQILNLLPGAKRKKCHTLPAWKKVKINSSIPISRE